MDILHRTVRIEESAIELRDGSTIFGEPKTAVGLAGGRVPGRAQSPLIEDHLANHVQAAPDSLVFTSREGLPLRRTKCRPHWAAACEKAGVVGLHFHDLRGSGATWPATAAATVQRADEPTGPMPTPAVALRYQHATLEWDKAIAGRLGALLCPDTPPPPDLSGEVVHL